MRAEEVPATVQHQKPLHIATQAEGTGLVPLALEAVVLRGVFGFSLFVGLSIDRDAILQVSVCCHHDLRWLVDGDIASFRECRLLFHINNLIIMSTIRTVKKLRPWVRYSAAGFLVSSAYLGVTSWLYRPAPHVIEFDLRKIRDNKIE